MAPGHDVVPHLMAQQNGHDGAREIETLKKICYYYPNYFYMYAYPFKIKDLLVSIITLTILGVGDESY